MTQKTDAALPFSTTLGWGIGTMAVAAMFNTVNVLLLRYLVDIVGIGAALAGTLIAGSKVYDAIIDPLVGTASDRTRSPWGRRRPYLLLGGVLIALSGWALFNVPAADLNFAVVWVVIGLLIYATGYAAFSVPYLAMPAEMTRRGDERAKLFTFRVLAVSVAGLIASFLGPIVIAQYGGGQAGHSAMAYIVIVLVLGSTLACFYMTRNAPSIRLAEGLEHPSFISQFKVLLESRPFSVLLGVKLLQLVALAVTQAATPFIFKGVLQISDTTLGIYFGVFSLAMVAAQYPSLKLTKRFSKRNLLIASTLLYAATYLTWYLVQPGDPMWQLYARAILLGLTGGAGLLFGQALLPEVMEWDARRSGIHREGYLAGLYTVMEKLSFAIAPAMSGLLLGWAGYIQGGGSAAVAQPATAIEALYWLGSIIPAFLLVLSAALLLLFRLDPLPGDEEEA